MKFAVFQNPVVFDLMNKLFAAPVPVKVAYRLSKIQKVFSSEAQKYQELRVSLVTKYAETNEEGTLVVDDAGNVKLIEGLMNALIAEMNELHDIDFELPFKITLAELEKVDLSAYDLGILEDLGVLDTE